MITRDLIVKILNAASMQRWNDKIRPVELRELDKQAHKMMIAYFLGKFEGAGARLNWVEIIEGGFFELLERLVLTDLKPQIFNRIKEDRAKYRQLNVWVFEKLKAVLDPLGEPLKERFSAYLASDKETPERRILGAAHLRATRWEFDIIERANPGGYEVAGIRALLEARQERYYDLKGIQQLALYERYRNFVDLCGQLRFQLRWAHTSMIPRVSVLGHMLMVAILSYLASLQIGACPKRCVNNYFTGLFHDLPEVLTRDIISPVKRSVEGIDELIKTYEREQMEREVYRLLPDHLKEDMRTFTQDEFSSIVVVRGRTREVTSVEISSRYNRDRYNPRDGEIVRAVDELAAFVEAHTALEHGIRSKDLEEAEAGLREKYRGRTVAGIPFGSFYEEFGPPAP
jgi:putative hydrolases of HD superfamily